MTDLPNRYSVDEDRKRPDDARIGPKLEVFLDGSPVTNCISFDVEAGVIERIQTDADGKILVDWAAGEAKRETLRGHVEVRWRENAGA